MTTIQYPIHVEPVLAGPEQVTESRWHQPWSDASFAGVAATFAVVLASASGQFAEPMSRPNDDPGKNAATWFANLSEPVRFKPRLITGAQQFAALVQFAPFGETPLESKFHFPWSEPKRFKPGLHAALHQVSPDLPWALTQPEQVSESRWHQPWSEPKRFRPRLGAGLNPFFFFQLPGGIPENVSYDKFGFAWSEPVRVKPRLGAGLNQSLAMTPAAPFPETVSYDKFGYPWSEPKRFPRQLIAAAQPTYVAPVNVTPPVIGAIAWYAPLSEPKRFKPALRTANQVTLAAGFPPSFEAVMESKFHFAWSEPVRVPARLQAGLNPYQAAGTIVPQFANARLTMKNAIVRKRTLTS